jgi:SAM-dependent methyltransferase
MYTISDYGNMLADPVRFDAYAAALRKNVTADSVVLDIGAGTGIFTALACEFGARKVYAIEQNDAIQLARKTIAANGYDDRVEFIQGLSTDAIPGEQADVIISDLRGVLPWYQSHLPSIIDARNRLLKPTGILIPRQDTVWISLVEAADSYRRVTNWEKNPEGLDLRAAREFVVNSWWKDNFTPDQLLSEPTCFANLDYRTINVCGIDVAVELKITTSGQAHGLCMWFDTVLVDGIGFSNAPGSPESVYMRAFFPFLQPIDLSINDSVKLRLSADLVDEDYIWRWETRVLKNSDPKQVAADFKQSNFPATPPSPDLLRRSAADYAPALSQNGELDRLILSFMDGRTSLEAIAKEVASIIPTEFREWRDALDRVSELSRKYAK